MADTSKRGYAQVNGTRLYYELTGQGEPLVLIHGFIVDTRMWDPQLQEFSKRYKVLRYDLRGYGKSAKPTGEEYTDSDDLMSLMRQQDIKQANIIGLSMGGNIALDFTLSYPEAAKKLVLVDPTLSGYSWTKEYGDSLNSIWTTCRERGLEACKAQFLDFEIFCKKPENPRAYSGLKRMVDDYSGIHFLHDVPVCRMKLNDPPIARRLSDIRAPTLIIVGERDSREFHIISDLLMRDVPHARRLIVPGVRHMVNMEDPNTFNREVLSFLSSP